MLRKKTPTSSYSMDIYSVHWKADRDISVPWHIVNWTNVTISNKAGLEASDAQIKYFHISRSG